MRPRIRPFEDRDAEAVVGLSLRVWASAYASLERVLGPEIFRLQHAEAGAGFVAVAMVETGGDSGHAPARRAYEKAGFALLPIARYFENL